MIDLSQSALPRIAGDSEFFFFSRCYRVFLALKEYAFLD
jgi:hypothetical protein